MDAILHFDPKLNKHSTDKGLEKSRVESMVVTEVTDGATILWQAVSTKHETISILCSLVRRLSQRVPDTVPCRCVPECGADVVLPVDHRLARELHVGVLLEHHNDVAAAELELGELIALVDPRATLDAGGKHDGRDLRHADGKHRDEPDLALDENEGAGLRELVAGRVERVDGALVVPWTHVAMHPEAAAAVGVGLDLDLEVAQAIDDDGFSDDAGHRRMLAVVVVGSEERVREDSAGEFWTPVRSRLLVVQQLGNDTYITLEPRLRPHQKEGTT